MQSLVVKNKSKILLLMAFFLFVSIVINSCPSKIDLINNGISEYSIYISENAAPPEKYAAREFQKTIKKIGGCELHIIHTRKPSTKMIY